MTQKILPYVITLSFLIAGSQASGQSPPNDACSSASEIIISDNGFGLGEFISDTSDLTEATREVGEKCSEKIVNFGNCAKTVWYMFRLGSTRNVSVQMEQGDNIKSVLNTGVTVYQSSSCAGNNEGSLMDGFLPILNFGTSGNECLSAGIYYVQVSSRKTTTKSIYLRVNIDLPKAYDFDSHKTPFFLNTSEYFYLPTQCVSLEANEAKVNLSSEYTKSVWLKVPIAEGLVACELTVSSTLTDTIAVRIFKSSVNKDSLASNKPYTFVSRFQNIMLYEGDCKLSSLDTVIVQVMLKEQEGRLEFRRYHTLPQTENTQWTNSRTPDRDTLTHSSYYNRYFNKFIACNSLLTNSQCEVVRSIDYSRLNPSYIGGEAVFKYAGYVVLDIRDSGMLRVDNRFTSNATVLFKGDIAGSCDLVEIDKIDIEISSYCITPGLYTLMYLAEDYKIGRIEVIYDLLKVNKEPPKFNTPETAERLGDINPLVGGHIVSDYAYYTDTKREIEIDGIVINQKMSFRELNLVNSGSISLQGHACDFYLFKGSVAGGTAKKIESWNYAKSYLKLGEQYTKSCLYLDKGLYTIVCVGYGSNATIACEGIIHSIEISTHQPCAISNTTPEGVLALNQNKNILEICDTIGYRDSYQLSQTFCADCYGLARNQGDFGCLTESEKLEGAYQYLTFLLPRNMSFGLGYYNSKSILYEGDIALNSDLIKDDSKKILNCDNGVFCNLKGGVIYTLLAYAPKSAEQSVTAIKINFAEHITTKNDFIFQSIDLGSISSDTTIQNSEGWISCHTNGHKEDLCFQFESYSRLVPSNYVISFPDSINKPRKSSPKTVWYTFTTKVPCTIDLDYSFYSTGANGSESYLLKYRGPYFDNFKELIANGLDTSITNFEMISTYSSLYNTLLCEPGRYFIGLVHPNQKVWPVNSQVKLEGVKANSPLPGDQCSDAINVDVPTYGKYRVNLNNFCHSYGGSPFEDETSSDLATSWIKIDIKDLNAFKISIDVPGVEYTLYGGDCGALTPIATNGEQYSYFTISCLASGIYYLQIADRYSSSRTRLVEIDILEEKDSLCTPYDYDKPNASFTYKGGCGDSRTVETINTSTQGTDMRYYWLVNNSLRDSVFNFIFDSRAPEISDRNEIRLIAVNKITGLSDTFSAIYQLDTTRYQFSISGPDSAYCFDKTVLKVSTTFTDKVNYEWFQSYPSTEYVKTLSYMDSLQLVRLDTFTSYIVNGESENCFFSDTFRIKFIKPFRLFRDTVLCKGEVLTLQVNEDIRWVRSSEHENVNNLSLDLSYSNKGTFWLWYQYKSCYNTDTFTIDYLPSGSDSFTVEHCFENGLLELDGLLAKDYLWPEDNSSERYYLASEYKDYPVLVTTLNDCRDSLIYTVQNDCSFEAFVPNTFTPNNDGVNDGFKPVVKSQFDRFEMVIYNRWGALVFDTKTSQSWDGMYENTAVQNGVYIYQIIIVEEGGARHFENGTVMILR